MWEKTRSQYDAMSDVKGKSIAGNAIDFKWISSTCLKRRSQTPIFSSHAEYMYRNWKIIHSRWWWVTSLIPLSVQHVERLAAYGLIDLFIITILLLRKISLKLIYGISSLLYTRSGVNVHCWSYFLRKRIPFKAVPQSHLMKSLPLAFFICCKSFWLIFSLDID